MKVIQCTEPPGEYLNFAFVFLKNPVVVSAQIHFVFNSDELCNTDDRSFFGRLTGRATN